MDKIVRLTNDETHIEVPIGRRGEYNISRVLFDVSEYIELYGEGHAELIVKNPTEMTTYVQPVTRDGNYIVWEITAVNTKVSGHGVCVLRWYNVDDGLAKSADVKVCVLSSSDRGVVGEMPDLVRDWLDAVADDKNEFVRIGVGIVNDAKSEADRAKEEADRAKGISDNIETQVQEGTEEIRQTVSIELSGALQHIERSTSDADHAIEMAETGALNAIQSATTDAIEDVGKEVNKANLAAEDAREEASKAVTSAESAKHDADRAKEMLDDIDSIISGKTEKVRVDFDGSRFTVGGSVLNFKQLYDIHLTSPDFGFVVYGDRAYLLSYVQDGNGMKEMRFQSVLAVTDSNGISSVKTSGIYVTSSDGINIASVRVTDINSENEAYKASEINDSNKNSDIWYPSNKAVTEAIAESESRLSESKADKVDTYTKTEVDTKIAEATPDDYDSLKKQVAENEREIGFIKKVSKGQLWDIEQREEEGHAQLQSGGMYGNVDEVRGKTEQDSTNGYQLFDGIWDRLPTYVGGITITSNDDGSLTLDGTASEIIDLYPFRSAKYGVGTFILSNNLGFINYFSNGSAFARNTMENPISSFVRINKGTVFNNDTLRIMLEKGSTAHSYEPYTGGIPSPNPDYPQEIVSVDEIHVKKCGKNLYKGTGKLFLSSDSTFIEQDGRESSIIKVKKGDTLIASGNADALNSGVLRVAFSTEYPAVGVSYTRVQSDFVRFTGYYTATGDGYVTIMLSKNTGYTFDDCMIQVEYGTVRTAYVPYTEKTLSIIPPRPLNKIGEYKDKMDIVNGVWEYNNECIKDASIFNWRKASSSIDYYASIPNKKAGKLNILCNKYTVVDKNYSKLEHGEFSGNSINNECDFRNDDIYKLTLKDWIEHSKTIELVYELAEPQTEPISADDLEFLRNLTLNEGEHLFITDNHGRDVSYLMSDYIDLRKVVES